MRNFKAFFLPGVLSVNQALAEVGVKHGLTAMRICQISRVMGDWMYWVDITQT